MLQFEKIFWNKNEKCIGIDEVGRGAFAGPMAIGAVLFDISIEEKFNSLPKGVVIRDSKKMSAAQRERSYDWILNNCIDYKVVYIEPEYIDKNGLTNSTQIGFGLAADKIYENHKINNLLIDAFEIKNNPNYPLERQIAIKKGDSLSLSIASASIVSKVERDRLMIELSDKYPVYNWKKNKGYGTLEHRESIRKHGLSAHHRAFSFSSSI